MRLLIVGSLNNQIAEATQIAMKRGAKVAHAESTEVALKHLRSAQGADLIMIEIGLDIRGFLESLEQERFAIPVVACGVNASPGDAAQAIRDGAKEFVPLPPEPELIAAVLEAVAEESHSLVYTAGPMENITKLADQIAGSDASVLITGESGTGKEVMARYVHTKSNRADRPFISINCAAIPDNLLESELFGHEKGAFTGAVARRIGKFEEANGGTLLLDEISEMDPRLQAKLLRAIQEREIDRVGGTKPVKVDIRLIATSNRNLTEAVKEGVFREDLLFRLNVVNLRLPPLRERKQDIVPLAEHFAAKYAKANQVPDKPLGEHTKQVLLSYGWPGNVRELENTMHRAVLLSTGPEIGSEAILTPDGQRQDQLVGNTAPVEAGSQSESQTPEPATHNPPAEAGDGPQAGAASAGGPNTMVGRTVAEVEQDLIIDTLYHCLGNRTHAANILGISIRTLRNKLKQYSEEGVDIPTPGGDGDRANA